mmetsp:Transcript_19990/g.47258  ORF Transcript_19990/g.47258 Transcript_19990/m.47258 type:complete len:287 (-) Transcript_19990:1515-2375(-)
MALRQGDPDVAELGLLLLTSAHIDRARSAADGTGRRRSALLGTCADAFALGTANRCGEGGRTSLNSSFRTAGGASDAKGIAHTHGSLPRESSGLVCAFGLRPKLVAATKAAAAAFRRLGLAGAWSLQEERLICEPSSGISASSSSSTETLTGTFAPSDSSEFASEANRLGMRADGDTSVRCDLVGLAYPDRVPGDTCCGDVGRARSASFSLRRCKFSAISSSWALRRSGSSTLQPERARQRNLSNPPDSERSVCSGCVLPRSASKRMLLPCKLPLTDRIGSSFSAS